MSRRNVNLYASRQLSSHIGAPAHRRSRSGYMMKLSQNLVAMSCGALVLCGVPSGAQSRDQIVVVGSTTQTS